MCGWIALFEGVDPNVALIETFAGGERDTAFRRPKTGWEAIDGRRRMGVLRRPGRKPRRRQSSVAEKGQVAGPA